MKYEAVLFDMDGVLIDSEHVMTKAGILGLRDFGVEAEPEDFIPFVGRGEDLYIGGVAEKHGVPYDKAMKSRSYEYYGQLVEKEARVPADGKQVLRQLKEDGYRIAVCTSADWDKVVHNLRAIGVKQSLFDAFVTGDKITHLKPDPEIYLTGARLCGVAPEKCLVVEDAPSGIKAAHAAGMKAAGIVSSFTEEYLRKEAGPDFIIHSLTEILGLLA